MAACVGVGWCGAAERRAGGHAVSDEHRGLLTGRQRTRPERAFWQRPSQSTASDVITDHDVPPRQQQLEPTAGGDDHAKSIAANWRSPDLHRCNKRSLRLNVFYSVTFFI